MTDADPEPERPTTRSRLLEAAAAEFSEKGIAGARVDAIAGRAGVNKQLVYYYFGSKEGLFRALLKMRLARPMAVPADEDPTTGERMAAAAKRHLADPDYVRLLMWEALDTGSDTPVAEESARQEAYGELLAGIRAAQEAGEIPADLDPGQVLLSRIAQVMFPVAFPQLTRLVTGSSIEDPAFAVARSRFLQRVYDDDQGTRR